ncbi:zinc finger protein 182-like [Armigeres subalbatus]|uniref:zinc finger protein 182-like n=1 Tax=Armigeres subalbatus TaxID=124917 RepID=UPI002ED4F28B
MSVCCVCRKRKITRSDIVFHGFPLDSAMAERWCEILGFERIPVSSAKVCGEHFLEDDYTTYDGATRNKTLKSAAVPSKNLGDNSQKSSAPEASTSIPTTGFGNVSDCLKSIEKILQKYAIPQSVKIQHESSSQSITITYSPVLDPVAPKEQKIICSKCNAIFKKPIDLQHHEKICRDKLNPFQCGKCNVTFKTITELGMHNSCEPKVPQTSPSEAVSDIDDETCPKKACEECPKYISVSNMGKHYVKHHPTKNAPFPCVICGLKLIECGELSKHLKSHTLKQLRDLKDKHPAGLHYSSEEQEYFECCLCGDVFKTKASCSVHQNHHLLPRVQCPVCQRMLNTKEEFITHLKKHAAK